MPGNDAIHLEGTVTEVLPAGRWRIRLDNGHRLVARVLKKQQAVIGSAQTGDRVGLRVNPGDMSQGIVDDILQRFKKEP
jgi:translation initiation factor IF-1